MMSNGTTDIRQQLLGFTPDARLEARILRIYHRELASRLWQQFTEPQSSEREYFERSPTVWLHPRAVWAARSIGSSPEFFESVRKLAYQDLLRSATPLPELEYIAGDYDDPWCATARSYLEEYDSRLGRMYSLEMATVPVDVLQGQVAEALG